jgi:hypothetical protein
MPIILLPGAALSRTLRPAQPLEVTASILTSMLKSPQRVWAMAARLSPVWLLLAAPVSMV